MDVLCIVGPTAIGKTKLSIALARTFNGEIISGDAFQFYKGLDIGTAKATPSEQEQAKHHLLDILEPNAEFSVADYQILVREKIKEIQSRGNLPIIVGGSGLYIQSVIEDYRFGGNQRDKTSKYETLPLETLQALLKEKNPQLYASIDIMNQRRVIRALEKDDEDIQTNPKPYYDDALIIGLNTDREVLYQRINERVVKMMDEGLLEEVKKLYDRDIHGQSIKAIGYKELYAYFDGLIGLNEAVELIQKKSRHYAKRQLTWFRNKMDVHWFDSNLTDFNQTIDQVTRYIKEAHQM